MKLKSLKLNALLNTIKTITALLFPVITFPYVSRVLQPEGIGTVNFANSIVSYFSIIASLGIGTYASRESAKVRDNTIELTKLVKEILCINFVSTIIAYILFFISLFTVSKFQDYKFLLFVCSLTIMLNTIGVDWLNVAMEDYIFITLRTIFFQIISVLLIFIFVKTKDDYIKYASISIFSSMGANILNFFHSRKYVKYFSKSEKLELKKHMKPIFILFSSSVAISIFTIMDTSMLGFLSSTIEVGYYSVASKLIRMIRDIFPAVFTVLFARFAYYYAKKDFVSYNALASKTINFILCFSLPLMAGLIIFSTSFIELFCGKGYIPATNSVIILSPLVFMSSCSGFLGGVIMITQGKEKQYLLTTVCAAFIDLILNFIFIPRFGAAGASFSTSLTEFFILIVYFILSKDLLAKICIGRNFLEYCISTTIMAICVFFTTLYINNIITKVIIGTFSGVIIYAICLQVIKNDYFIMTKDDILKKIKKKYTHIKDINFR